MRRADVVLAIAAVATAGLLGIALRPQHTPTVAADPGGVGIQRPAVSSAPRPAALVISDGYASGSGLAELSPGCRAATAMGWLCAAAAEAGTGYISGGTANRFQLYEGSAKSTSFGERITRLGPAYDPDVVILDGGRNDLFAPVPDRLAVMVSTIRQAHLTWPRARIVVVAPRFLDRPRDDLGIPSGALAALRDNSGVKDLVVVDPVSVLKGSDPTPLMTPNKGTPSPEGDQALGAALAGELRRGGLVQAP